MTRFPSPFTQKYLAHESEERLKRVLDMKVEYRNCANGHPLPEPIVDRDPGDEHDDTRGHFVIDNGRCYFQMAPVKDTPEVRAALERLEKSREVGRWVLIDAEPNR